MIGQFSPRISVSSRISGGGFDIIFFLSSLVVGGSYLGFRRRSVVEVFRSLRADLSGVYGHSPCFFAFSELLVTVPIAIFSKKRGDFQKFKNGAALFGPA